MSKLTKQIKQFTDALEELQEALAKPKDEFMRDSSIKRFELTFDLAWKTLKSYLEEEKGLICHSPKDCFRQAFQSEVINYDDFWLEIVEWRNETVHAYDEELANDIYKILPKILKYFQALQTKFQ